MKHGIWLASVCIGVLGLTSPASTRGWPCLLTLFAQKLSEVLIEKTYHQMRLSLAPILVLFSFLWSFAPGKAVAGVNQWTTNGPWGGELFSFAIAPDNPSTLYAGSVLGVFKSTDSGTNWTRRSIPFGVANILAFDPSNTATVYVGTRGGVVKSTDGGATWTALGPFFFTSIRALAVDPVTPSTVYIGVPTNSIDQLYKSIDAGATWIRMDLQVRSFLNLTVDPEDPNIVYAGVRRRAGISNGVLKSTDAGLSWTDTGFPGSGFEGIGGSHVVLDPHDSNIVYATDKGVFRSTDGGVTWENRSAGLPDDRVTAFTIDPENPARLYVGSASGGVFRSRDSGLSWTATSFPALTATVLAVTSGAVATVYGATAEDGVFASSDAGISWTARNTGIFNVRGIRELALSPLDPNIVYAGSFSGVFQSLDGGQHWTRTGFPNEPVHLVTVDPLTPTTVYAAGSGAFSAGVFKSLDGGASWMQIDGEGLDRIPSVLIIDPQEPMTLYAGVPTVTTLRRQTHIGTVFKSTDGGTTWIDTLLPTSIHDLVLDPTRPATVYAGGNEVFKSTDGGGSWETLETGFDFLSVEHLAIAPADPLILYASVRDETGSRFLKTTDGGTTWTRHRLNVPDTCLHVHDLVVDPHQPHTIYVATFVGIWRSTDGGVNWASLNRGLTDQSASSLAITSGLETTLYTGTDSDGAFAFRLTDLPPTGILALFESPSPRPVAGADIISGWAVTTQASERIDMVELFIDDISFGDIPCCSIRVDVQASFPELPSDNTLNSGWGLTFNWALLQAGVHPVQIQITDTAGERFLSQVRDVTVVKLGDSEFLDQFDVSGARASLIQNAENGPHELVLAGVRVRDKQTMTQTEITVSFRWFASTQSFGLVATQPATAQRRPRALPHQVELPVSAAVDTPPSIRAFFDNPGPQQIVGSIATIHGWAFPEDPTAVIRAVRLFIDGEFITLIPCCAERTDVPEVFPDSPNALPSGWGLTFNYSLLSPGPHTLEIEIEDSTGETLLLTHPVTAVVPGGFEFVDQLKLTDATTSIVGNEIVLAGVQIRDKLTQQVKVVTLRLAWLPVLQTLGIVSATE